MVVLDLALRKQWRPALLLAVALPVSFLLGWISLGQRIENVRPFLAGIVWFVDGYDQALGLTGMALFKTRGELSLGLVLAFVTTWGLSLAISRVRGSLLAIGVSLLIWLVWKHAFVRADFYHVSIFLGFVALLPLLLNLLPSLDVPLKRWGLFAGVACCLVPIYTLQFLSFPEFRYSLAQPFRAIAQNVRSLLFSEAYQADRTKELDLATSKVAMPMVRQTVGVSTIDVFGQNQAHAVLNALNFQPRPVFQSYAAYNRKLMEINEQFYLSPAAPDYVLFDLDPIDHQFPPLEDACVLRDLLFNYSLIDYEKNFLILRRKSEQRPVLTLLQAGEIPVSGKIPLETFGTTNLWLELSVQPTIRGRAQQYLYKLPKPRIKIWLEGKAKPLAFPAPAPMLDAGFLASPLLLNNQDVERYYRTGEATRPVAYGIEFLPEDAGCWETRVSFRLCFLKH